MRSSGTRNEELTSIGVGTAVGHGQESRTAVLMGRQIFIGKGRAVDAEFPRTFSREERKKIAKNAKTIAKHTL